MSEAFDKNLLWLMQNHLYRSHKNDRFFYDVASKNFGEYATVEAAKQVAETNRLVDLDYHEALKEMLEDEPYHRQSFYLYSRDDVVNYNNRPNANFLYREAP